jgi:hypothetical protein
MLCAATSAGQEAAATAEDNIPVATQLLLDGVKRPVQKGVIKSVLMVMCRKDGIKGTGFSLSGGGVITTNSHVVGSCTAGELEGRWSLSDHPVKFIGIVKDPNRDLALLCPARPLTASLVLSGDENPAVETEVETWGYPLRYENPAPILSRGYVAGYTVETHSRGSGDPGTPVKHLIVNGAINPGNSGGPLIDRTSGKVIGIVVEKWTLWSPSVGVAIQGFSHPQVSTGGTFSRVNAQGQREGISDQQMVAVVLKEFYDASQVMVGEAISVSELKAFIKEKQKTLGCNTK